MTRASEVMITAVPFVWWGMVLAISFLETPLKFRAPGITIPLGLGIGRLVFRALNAVEVALVVAMVVLGLVVGPSMTACVLIVVLLVLLVLQVIVLRPRLDARAAQLIQGAELPASHQHVLYIVLEGVKVVVLPVLGAVLATSVLA